MMDPNIDGTFEDLRPGDVFQIDDIRPERAGWHGCLVLADEIRPWGIIAMLTWPENHEQQAQSFVQLNWPQLGWVGRAPLIRPSHQDTSTPDLFTEPTPPSEST